MFVPMNTLPPATIEAFLEHGHVEATLEQGIAEAEQTMKALEEAGISIEQVTEKLLADGVRLFADSFEKLLANIEEKQTQLA